MRRFGLITVGLVVLVGAACLGDVTETTDISSTTMVPVTDVAPYLETVTTTSRPPFRVSLEQVLGGAVSTEEPPTPEFVGDRTYVDWSGMATVTVGGPGLVAGGSGRTVEVGSIDAAVWTSRDGRGWQRVDDEAGVFGDAMSVNGVGSDQFISDIVDGSLGVVAVGGDGLMLDHDAAVWVSSDGLVWERLPHDADVFGGEGDQFMHAVVQWDGRAVVVGESAGKAAAWVSNDGRQWMRAEVNDDSIEAGIGPSVMEDVAVAAGRLVAVGSAGLDSGPAVWLSPDGLTWSRLLDSMAGTQSGFETAKRPMTAVAGGERGFVAIGTELRPEQDSGWFTKGPLVWVSVDGFEWQLLAATFIELTDEQETSRYAYLKRASPVVLEDVAWEGDRMLAIGGYEHAPTAEAAPNFVTIWTSTDGGVTWRIADEMTQEPSDCWCGAREFTRFGDTAVLVGTDAIAAEKHPKGWTTWATTPAVWIASLPAH